MGTISVVVNYKSNEVFASNDDPDVGYVQFTRADGRVYIVVDGRSVGFVPADEFARIQPVITTPPEQAMNDAQDEYSRALNSFGAESEITRNKLEAYRSARETFVPVKLAIEGK